MTPQKARTAVAARIARIDRQRFNEIVAAGHYPCAPKTTKGASRVFGVDDLIALFLFARLAEHGFAPANAGQVACLVRSQLTNEGSADETFVCIARAVNGATFAALGSKINADASRFSELPILYTTKYHIPNIREIVLAGLAEEAGIIGEDDE